MVVEPGKLLFVLPVPCHVKDQPPEALEISLDPFPTTKIVESGSKGSIFSLFLSKTRDSLTACLAMSLCSFDPIESFIKLNCLSDGFSLANRP